MSAFAGFAFAVAIGGIYPDFEHPHGITPMAMLTIIGMLLWPSIFFVLGRAENPLWRPVFLVLMGVQYLATAAAAENGVRGAWKERPSSLVLFALFFIFSQLTIWVVFFRAALRHRKQKNVQLRDILTVIAVVALFTLIVRSFID